MGFTRLVFLSSLSVGICGCLDTTALTTNSDGVSGNSDGVSGNGDEGSGAVDASGAEDQAIPAEDGAALPDLRAVVDLRADLRVTAMDLTTSPDLKTADAAVVPDLNTTDMIVTCGLPGLSCCNGSCSSGCCDPGTSKCVAFAGACAAQNTVCSSTSKTCVPCGQSGQLCCAAVTCLFGGCCVASGTVSGNICTASGTSPLQTGNVCNNGIVVHCGLPSDPCCPGTSCNGGGCCDGNRCIGAGTTCAASADICASSSCSMCPPFGPCQVPCGGSGEACCAGGHASANYCTALNLACVTVTNGMTVASACVACGQPGQPCCPGNSCNGNTCCDHGNMGVDGYPKCVASGGQCSNGQGSCDEGGCLNGGCGKARQPFCPSNVDCTGRLTIRSNTMCNPCGGLSQACCIGTGGGFCSTPFACSGNGTCQPCGGNGETCCPGSQCYSSTNKLCDFTSGLCK